MADKTELELAYETLDEKQTPYTSLWDYYYGDQPLVYATNRLQEAFSGLNTNFSQNWCAVVVNAVLDRLNLKQFVVSGNDEATDLMGKLWTSTEMHLDEHDAHTAALVIGEAYVIVWREAKEQVVAYYNDPRLCHVFYDADDPRVKRFAAKWWVDGQGKRRLNLYYPDRIEYYRSVQAAENVSSYRALLPLEGRPVETNPFGEIPVFHLRRERRVIESELTNVIEPQNAINKLLADMMVAAEFGAFRQRYVISNMDVGKLKNAPNEIWDLPAGDGMGQATQVGEFGETNLSNYLDAMDKLAASIAIITRTPRHYLFSHSGQMSGEALIAMEAPLNKKVTQYIERFSAVWCQVAHFMLALSGVQVEPEAITAIYDDPATVQPLMQAQMRQTNVSAGLPLITVLRKEGWTEGQIAEMQRDQETEQEMTQKTLAGAMLDAQRNFDQN